MLLIKTYIDKSKIHGIGLFTKEFIPKGTVVWEYNDIVDKVISIEELSEIQNILNPDVFKDLRTHIARVSEDLYMMFGDNAKFINHSTDSNMLEVSIYMSVAKRDIERDEELTEDYIKTYFYKEDFEFLKEVKDETVECKS